MQAALADFPNLEIQEAAVHDLELRWRGEKELGDGLEHGTQAVVEGVRLGEYPPIRFLTGWVFLTEEYRDANRIRRDDSLHASDSVHGHFSFRRNPSWSFRASSRTDATDTLNR